MLLVTVAFCGMLMMFAHVADNKYENVRDPTSKDAKLFRRRFRFPFVLFQELVEKARSRLGCAATDASGNPCIHIRSRSR